MKTYIEEKRKSKIIWKGNMIQQTKDKIWQRHKWKIKIHVYKENITGKKRKRTTQMIHYNEGVGIKMMSGGNENNKI